jgi:hypothetical protein
MSGFPVRKMVVPLSLALSIGWGCAESEGAPSSAALRDGRSHWRSHHGRGHHGRGHDHHRSCEPGTRQRGHGRHGHCVDCEPGTFCAGGRTPEVACATGTWDHDADAATRCVDWGECRAGQYVAQAGSTLTDRACEACAEGETSNTANAAACAPAAWLLSYFWPHQDVSSDSLRLGYSMDGQRWGTLGGNQPAYQLTEMGTNHIRDPFIFRKNDGTFVYLATDWTLADNESGYWSHPSPRIFIADSDDLITFENPRLVTVTDLPGPDGQPMHAWAPEAYYDEERDCYVIVWSGNDTTGVNRIYASYTEDFVTVLDPTPEVLFDPSYSVIDATIERSDGRNYLFFKDETDLGGPDQLGKDIQIAIGSGASLAPGSFAISTREYITRGTSQSVRQATEGPFAIFQPDAGRWIMYADYYLNGGVFGAWATPALDAAPSSWTRLRNSEFRFPSGVRHAHAVRVTVDELDALIDHYGIAHLLRTTYSESGAPFYVAHSWYHGIITTLDDRGRGQLADDFAWRVVPGLADPSDPELVSFEPIGFPGRYLRVDSTRPSRYPSCSEGSNRGWALCWVGAGERNHLTWVDADDGSATFRSDATFRRVPALNGNPLMVSLAWHTDPSRYLRHIAYQMFATPISGTVQQNDASFVIERE